MPDRSLHARSLHTQPAHHTAQHTTLTSRLGRRQRLLRVLPTERRQRLQRKGCVLFPGACRERLASGGADSSTYTEDVHGGEL
jgi:hypothetical protein